MSMSGVCYEKLASISIWSIISHRQNTTFRMLQKTYNYILEIDKQKFPSDKNNITVNLSLNSSANFLPQIDVPPFPVLVGSPV